jgi:hypothetical protein
MDYNSPGLGKAERDVPLEDGQGKGRMKRVPVTAVLVCLATLSACTAEGTTLTATIGFTENNAADPFPPTLTVSATSTPAATPTETATPTDFRTPTPTSTLAPNAWQSMPVVPAADRNTRRVYQDGQGFGNDAHAFSILGDCISLSNNFFGDLGKGPENYKLGDYAYLEAAIEWFRDSFNRQSVTLGDGFNSASVLSPLWTDPKRCEKNETPLVCEYRIQHPSYAIVSLGTDDKFTSPKVYEDRMRQIVEYSLSHGVIPILATKADNREGNYSFNRILAALAYEYDVPLWNFWAAVQPLYLHGLADSHGHLTWAEPDDFENPEGLKRGVPIRSLTALQTLDSLWHGVTAQ